MERVRFLLHFAQRYPVNSLIELANRDSSGIGCIAGQLRWLKKGLK